VLFDIHWRVLCVCFSTYIGVCYVCVFVCMCVCERESVYVCFGVFTSVYMWTSQVFFDYTYISALPAPAVAHTFLNIYAHVHALCCVCVCVCVCVRERERERREREREGEREREREYVCFCVCICVCMWTSQVLSDHTYILLTVAMGWLRSVGSIKL